MTESNQTEIYTRTGGGMTRSRSEAAFRRASLILPGGVNRPVRAFGAVGGDPVLVVRVAGPAGLAVVGMCAVARGGSWGAAMLSPLLISWNLTSTSR